MWTRSNRSFRSTATFFSFPIVSDITSSLVLNDDGKVDWAILQVSWERRKAVQSTEWYAMDECSKAPLKHHFFPHNLVASYRDLPQLRAAYSSVWHVWPLR